ncbi:MAG: DNA-3-methyladenine glycosylase 2 family protein [Actinomycetota bacterium]|nr:MAG: DNA-3-methyladenine glycosylase 2 family protein [Actinomycetota bacterium]
MTQPATLTDDHPAYRALVARDPRFDGRLWFGVTSTGVYCRPVCPARTPLSRNVRPFRSPAAAVAAGFRACRRCRPDTAPGSRQYDARGDLAARALRAIAAGDADDGGVAGLASRLHVSPRHLHRILVSEVGVGPLQLASSRRARTAALLVEQSALPLSDIAFAAGFASIRQFNDVMQREFGLPPSALRHRSRRRDERRPVERGSPLTLRLRWRPPYDVAAMLAHVAARAVAGVELVDVAAGTVSRLLPLPHGPAGVTVRFDEPAESLVVSATDVDIADVGALVPLVRRWFDLDAAPLAVADALRRDAVLAPLVQRRPGLRVPVTPTPWEALVRAIVGQRISVAAARAALGRIASACGAAAVAGPPGPLVCQEFPTAATVLALGTTGLTAAGITAGQARALVVAAERTVRGDLDLTASASPAQLRQQLLEIGGVGPWTAQYVALRGLADPDSFPVGDAGLQRAARSLGLGPHDLVARSTAWAPWRSYAAQQLWTFDPQEEPA